MTRQSWDEMTLEQAQHIMASIVENKQRWGKQWDGSEIGFSRILDAVVVLGREGNKADAAVRAQLATANRQLAAAKAREAKYRKKLGLKDTRDDSLIDLEHDDHGGTPHDD